LKNNLSWAQFDITTLNRLTTQPIWHKADSVY